MNRFCISNLLVHFLRDSGRAANINLVLQLRYRFQLKKKKFCFQILAPWGGFRNLEVRETGWVDEMIAKMSQENRQGPTANTIVLG